jgi:hypothetical protein
MKNIFELFGDKKASDEAKEAHSKQQWQSRTARIAEILRASMPVFKEYEGQLQKGGIAAKLIPIGTVGLQFKIPMK